MRTLFIATAITTLLCAGFVQAQQPATDMDSQVANVADSLVSQIKASGKKQLAVLDFTDLEGNTTEQGRLIAEHLSVDLVQKRDGFCIMDRAHLKAILDEHKLAIEGLVQPENAKKLGQFSGVDAIILGNAEPLDNRISITAKIIATDTAEIVGAAKGDVSKAKVPEQPRSAADPKTNQSDGLTVTVESLKASSGGASLLATFIFANTSADTLGVALGVGNQFRAQITTTISDKEGTEFLLSPNDLAGIAFLSQQARFTRMSPGDRVAVTAKYYQNHTYNPIFPPLRVQMQVWIVPQVDGEFAQARLNQHNFVLDVEKLAGASLQGATPNSATPSYYITRPGYNYNYNGGAKRSP